MSDGIQTRDLRKAFSSRDRLFGPRREKTAVDGLNLDIPRGRVTGLLGLNGAGKTTTIKMLATLLRPDSGTATMDGWDIVDDAREVRRRINLIAGGERMVYARLTGRENLQYFGRLYNVPSSQLKPRIEDLLELVGLVHAASLPVERYSRGMAQRLSIARGLINDPEFLLLDEPTLGLDAPIARDLREVVRRLVAEGKGVLLTSHNLAEVEELCAYVYVIAEGAHLAQGAPAEVTAATGCHHTVSVTLMEAEERVLAAVREFAARLGAEATEKELEAGAVQVGVSHRGEVAGPLLTAVINAGGVVADLTVTEPSLEDAILRLSEDQLSVSSAEGVLAV